MEKLVEDEVLIMYQGYSDRFLDLSSKSHEILYALGQKGFDPKEDARSLVFDHLLQHIEFSRYSLNQYLYHLQFTHLLSGSVETRGDFLLKEVFKSPLTLIDVNGILLKKIIHYPLPNFYYTIENYFFNILNAINGSAPSSAEQLLNNIFDLLQMTKSGDDYEAYRIIAYFRHSLHNNSVHEHPDKSFCFKGKSFNFVKKNAVEYPDEDSIFEILEAVVESLEEITFHSKIMALQSVSERFATSISTP